MAKCNNEQCNNHNDDEYADETHCELFEDPTECEHFIDDRMPVHNGCGLPVELCVCPDARIKFIDGKFIDTKPDAI